MMKRILSVALSVIMVLGLINVPGFAAEPMPIADEAVEYTVSAVTYSAKTIPASGSFTASVDVSASAASKVSVIFATLQDDVLLSAKYQTEEVGTGKTTFTGEFEANAAYAYKVFVVETATGKALAPEANFPTHENKLAYVDITYVTGETERIFAPVNEEEKTISIFYNEEIGAGNPTFKFVAVDNSSKITTEGGRDFWDERIKVILTSTTGATKEYFIEPTTIRLSFKPTVAAEYSFVNVGKRAEKQAFETITATMVGTEATVDVPAGTTQVTMAPFKSGNTSVSGATIAFTGASAQHKFKIGATEYTVKLRWDEKAPSIYNVTRNFEKADRSFYLRANGLALNAVHNTTNSVNSSTISLTAGADLAGAGADLNVKINGEALPNDASTLTIVTAGAETGYRIITTSDIHKQTGSWIKGNDTNVWMKFTPSADGTVYVCATQADAIPDAGYAAAMGLESYVYTWDEITNEDGTLKDGWREVENATLGSNEIKLFAKDFTAGNEVVIPTQKFDRDEWRYAKWLLSGEGYSLTSYSSDPLPNLIDNGATQTSKWYTRRNDMHTTGVRTGYAPITLLCFNQNPTTEYNPDLEGADKLDLWYTTDTALEAPATQTVDGIASAANIKAGDSVYTGGIYQVPASSYVKVDVDHEEKTFEIVVPYGTETVTSAVRDAAGQDLAGETWNLINNGGLIEDVTIAPAGTPIHYTGVVRWASYDAAALSEDAPLVYDLKHYADGKEDAEIAKTDSYSAMPTRLTLNAANDLVKGTSDLKDFSKTLNKYTAGNWFTVQSHNKGNYTFLDGGKHYNNLHISGESFASWVENGVLTDKYALDGATLLVADYKDAPADGKRYDFKTVQAGYVIAAYAAEQNDLGADWAQLTDSKIATTMSATQAQKEMLVDEPDGHANAVSDFAYWGESYNYIYIKKVAADAEVSINETTTTANMPAIVIVATEDMFPAPTLRKLSYKVGDGEAELIDIEENATTATITVPFTREAISVLGEINGTGSVTADKSVVLDYETNREDAITVEIKNVAGEVVKTYTITVQMDYASAQTPTLKTLTYKVGSGDTKPITVDEDGAIEPISVLYTMDEISVQAEIDGDGYVEISDPVEFTAPDYSGNVTVKVLDVPKVEVETYTIAFEADLSEVEDPVFESISYKIGDEETLIDLGDAKEKTITLGTLVTGEVSLVAKNDGTGSWEYTPASVSLSEANPSGTITATLKNISGQVVDTYTITIKNPRKPELTTANITSTLAPTYTYSFTLDKITRNTEPVTTETVSPVKTQTGYDVIVPYGTQTVVATLVDEDNASVATTVDLSNVDSKTVQISIGDFTYNVTFKWNASAPYIYNVAYSGYSYPKRNAVMRGGQYLYLQQKIGADWDKTSTTSKSAGATEAIATPDDAMTSIKIDGQALANSNYLTMIVPSYSDSLYRPWSGTYHYSTQKVAQSSNANWTSFTPSAAGTVYVRMSHANVNADNYVWEEVANDNTWVKVTSAKLGEEDIVVYKKTFAANERISIPSQAITEAELAYVNAQLEEAYPADNGKVQLKYDWVTPSQTKIPFPMLHYSTDGKEYTDDAKVWTVLTENKTAQATITCADETTISAYGEYVRGGNSGVGTFGSPLFIAVAFDKPAAQANLRSVDEEPTQVNGEVLAVEAEDVNTTQNAGSTDITVAGSDAAYANEVVAVYVLANGKSMSDLTTALENPSGDLAGLVLAMGKAWADDEGNFTVDLTLPEDVDTGSYNVGIVTDTAEEADLVFVDLDDQIDAYNAIVNAADGVDVANPFEHVEYVINTYDIYAADGFDTEAVQNAVLADPAVADLEPIDTITPDIATLAAIIDAQVAYEAIKNGGDAGVFAALNSYVLDDADLTADALDIYEGGALNATGAANVLDAIAGVEADTYAEIKALVSEAIQQAAFVNLINNTAYESANSVLPFVEKYDDAGLLVGTNGAAMNDVTLTALADIIKGTDITGYTDFADRVNKLTGTTEKPLPPAPGGQTGNITNDNRPSQEGGNTVGGTSYPVGPTTKLLSSFADANAAAWAATALQTMLDRNILGGYEDNTIRPNNSATRQEVAKMLVSAFSTVRPYAWTGFSDVPAGSWYYSYVATAAEDGIIKGTGDGKFGTDANITREDLSVLIYRFLASKGIALNTAATRTFTDAASMSDYAVEAINALTNAGIVNGYTDGSYNPKGNATRAEIAQIIANVIVIYAL